MAEKRNGMVRSGRASSAAAAMLLCLGCGEQSHENTPQSGGSGGTQQEGGAGTAGSIGSGGGGGFGGSGATGGACQPTFTQPTDNPDAVALVDVMDSDGVSGMKGVAVSGDFVLYVDQAGLARIPKAGGAPERVFSSPNVGGVEIVDESAYWLADGTLFSVPLSATNGAATTVLDGIAFDPTRDSFIAIDTTHAYLSIRATNDIKALELATGNITTLVAGVSTRGWLVDGGFMYYVGPNDGIERISLSGGTPQVLHRANHIVWSVGIDGDKLYYGGSDTIFAVAEPFDTEVMYSPNIGFIERVIPHGDRLLFEGWQGSLGWVSKDSRNCQGLVDSVFDFEGWAYDDANVFIALDGVLYRIPL
jgi:hypothetical protein